jgi:hypothetical protein
VITISAFVESPVYVVAAALVVFVAVFWFTLNHDRSLLVPYIVSTALVVGVSMAVRLFFAFFISLPSLMVGLFIHFWLAALLSYQFQRMIGRR